MQLANRFIAIWTNANCLYCVVWCTSCQRRARGAFIFQCKHGKSLTGLLISDTIYIMYIYTFRFNVCSWRTILCFSIQPSSGGWQHRRRNNQRYRPQHHGWYVFSSVIHKKGGHKGGQQHFWCIQFTHLPSTAVHIQMANIRNYSVYHFACCRFPLLCSYTFIW